MNWRNVRIIFRKEAVDLLRDKRTLFVMTILPILMYPLILIGFTMLTQRQMRKQFAEHSTVVVVGGGADVNDLLFFLKNRPRAAAETEEEYEQRGQLAAKLTFEARPSYGADLKQSLLDKRIHAVLTVPAAFKADLESGDPARVAAARATVQYDSHFDKSLIIKNFLDAGIEAYKRDIFLAKMAARELPAGYLDKSVEAVNIGAKGTGYLAGMLAFLLVTMSLTGAFYPAIDLAAGEKERGTMETLLISPALRTEIVLAKFFSVFAIALVAAGLNLLSLGLSVMSIPVAGAPRAAQAFSLDFGVVQGVYMMALLVPLVAFFSALSLALSAFARSFKEGQNYLNPLMIAVFFPSFAAMLPGMQLDDVMCFVPVLSTTLLFKEFFADNFQFTHLVMILGSTVVYSLLAIQWTVSLFQREEVLFRESDEINWTFWVRKGRRREAPGGFESLFVFVVSIVLFWYVNTLSGIRNFFALTILAHVVAILGVALAAVKLLNLQPRAALGWARPRVSHLALAPVMAAAGYVIVFTLIAWQAEQDLPHNEEAQRLQEQLLQLDLWQCLAFIALMPAITEELLFRGVVLSGYKRAMGVWRGVFATAVCFGLEHLDASRLMPTILLGIVLGYIVVRSGSIVPAMLYHFTHNALAALGPWLENAAQRAPGGWAEAAGQKLRWLLEPATHTPLPLAGSVVVVLCGLYLMGRGGRAKPSADA